MVEIIGLVTLGMLVWVLASSLATESDAEKRRPDRFSEQGLPEGVGKVQKAA